MTQESKIDFSVQPIGVIRTPYTQASGTPIQGAFAKDVEGTVEIFEPFLEGLLDLELFSHIFLLYRFDRAKSTNMSVTPYLDDRAHGVFATRAPARPNNIGLSVVRLLERDGVRLRVSGVDMLDETPLLDVKPYVPTFDCRTEANSGWIKAANVNEVRTKADSRFESQ